MIFHKELGLQKYIFLNIHFSRKLVTILCCIRATTRVELLSVFRAKIRGDTFCYINFKTLKEDNTKFLEFFKLSSAQIVLVSSLIKDDTKMETCNRHLNLIILDGKFSLTCGKINAANY